MMFDIVDYRGVQHDMPGLTRYFHHTQNTFHLLSHIVKNRVRWLPWCATRSVWFDMWCSTQLTIILCNKLCSVWPVKFYITYHVVQHVMPGLTRSSIRMHKTLYIIHTHDQRQGPGQLAPAGWLVTCRMTRWPILVYTHHVAKSRLHPLHDEEWTPTQYKNNDCVGDEYSHILYCRVLCSPQN